MKRFVFDTLVDEENLCNLQAERAAIEKAVLRGQKLILFAPRNFGKTSLIKNVVIPAFKKRCRKSFVLFVDLLGVRSLEAIERRVARSFALAFAEAFPAKNVMEAAKRFLSRLRPQVTLDPATGSPAITIGAESASAPTPLEDIFRSLAGIGEELRMLLVFDEFQDIAVVPEAEARFRAGFQEFPDVPVILMGSKRHLLANLFAKPEAPLASFGQDLEFKPIPYDEYRHYMQERFRERKLRIDLATATYLQDKMLRIPEPVNIVCAHLSDVFANVAIDPRMVDVAIDEVVAARQSRFEQYLSNFSEKEEELLVAIAKHGPVRHYNGREFLKTVSTTSRMVGIIVQNLWNRSVLEKDEKGYRVADPLLCEYLRRQR